jgi:hypothetical protein
MLKEPTTGHTHTLHYTHTHTHTHHIILPLHTLHFQVASFLQSYVQSLYPCIYPMHATWLACVIFHLIPIMIFHKKYHFWGSVHNSSPLLSLIPVPHRLTLTINVPTSCYQRSPQPHMYRSPNSDYVTKDSRGDMVRFPLFPAVTTSSN